MERWLHKACALIDEIQWTAMQMAGLRNALVHDLGLDRYRWAVLLAISRSDYCLSISDLARALKQSRQGMHRMVVGMARAGGITLLPNSDDRRILQLELSPAGKRAIGQICQCFEAAVLEISAHLDGRTIHRTTEVLNSLRARIDERQQLSRSRAPEMLPR